MSPGLIILIVVAGAGLVALVIYAAIQAEKARQQRIAEMRAYAQEAGLSFREEKDTSHDEEYAHFELFRRGFDRAAYNTIFGKMEYNDAVVDVNMGDFTYKTRERYTTTDSKGRTRTRTRIVKHHFSYFIMELPYITMPDLLIRREGLFDRIASAFGKNDIDFESAEFSRKYFVKCDSRKFAYDIIHPRMMEFLLETKPGLIDIENARICLADGYSVWKSPRFGHSLHWTRRFLDHWPDFVVKDLAEGRAL
ncbi:MAG: hypothetical protein ACX94C_12910 [Phycisphaerales bacterium]